MSRKDKVSQTFIVAFVLSVICAVVVSFAAVELRPVQTENRLIDKKKNILVAANLLSSDRSVDEIFAEKIKPRLIDIATGQYSDQFDPVTYDARKAAKDPKTAIAIPADKDIAKIKRQAKYETVYEVFEEGQLSTIVLPINGKGLWSTLYGFIALKANTQEVVGLTFYEHAETPGLGGEVDNPKWKAQWNGKQIYDENGDLAITVLKGKVDTGSPDAVHQIDGLSGSTLTTNGVRDLVRYWLGPNGYGPYLENLRQRENPNG